jgi:hypothetical protein
MRDIQVGDLVRYTSPIGAASYWHKQLGRVVRDAGVAERGREKGDRFFEIRFKRAPRFKWGPYMRPLFVANEFELTLIDPDAQPSGGTRRETVSNARD